MNVFKVDFLEVLTDCLWAYAFPVATRVKISKKSSKSKNIFSIFLIENFQKVFKYF